MGFFGVHSVALVKTGKGACARALADKLLETSIYTLIMMNNTDYVMGP